MFCCSGGDTVREGQNGGPKGQRTGKKNGTMLQDGVDDCLECGTCCFGELLSSGEDIESFGVLLAEELDRTIELQTRSIYEVSITMQRDESVAWAFEVLPATCCMSSRNAVKVGCHWFDKSDSKAVHQEEDVFGVDGFWPRKVVKVGERVTGMFTAPVDTATFILSFDNRFSSIDKKYIRLSVSHRGYHHGSEIRTPYGTGVIRGWTNSYNYVVDVGYGQLYLPSETLTQDVDKKLYHVLRGQPKFRMQHIYDSPSNCPSCFDMMGFNRCAGAFHGHEEAPSQGWMELTEKEQTQLNELMTRDGFDVSRICDYHVHVIGSGQGGSGIYLTPKMTDPFKAPFGYTKLKFFMSAAGITLKNTDLHYEKRLLSLCRHFQQDGQGTNKMVCLAFDKTYDPTGIENISKTTFHIPNDHVFDLAKRNPDNCIPACSVHPYRLDCESELERCYAKGSRIVKWLPNSMLIDPMSELCDRFYRKMSQLGMVLLSHVGEEHSVTSAAIHNEYGNPLRLRRALDHNVKVIAAHFASEGTSIDLDKATSGTCMAPREDNFKLLLRLFREDKYKELLFADFSAIICVKRAQYLKPLLDATDVHSRIVYGSDYPVPCLNFSVILRQLQAYGLIDGTYIRLLRKVYKYNPLLFDFLCKRLVKSPKGNRFPNEAFYEHPLLKVSPPPTQTIDIKVE